MAQEYKVTEVTDNVLTMNLEKELAQEPKEEYMEHHEDSEDSPKLVEMGEVCSDESEKGLSFEDSLIDSDATAKGSKLSLDSKPFHRRQSAEEGGYNRKGRVVNEVENLDGQRYIDEFMTHENSF